MKKAIFTLLALAVSICMNAASFTEATLSPSLWSIPSDKPFVKSFDEVVINFYYPIKFIDKQAVELRCDGETVARSESIQIVNDKETTGWEGALVVRFAKTDLPKGKTYTLILPTGTVGWTECYNDIQVINMESTHTFFVPENLGTPEIFASSMISDSSHRPGISYLLETKATEGAAYRLYREGEEFGRYGIEIENYDIPLSQIHPVFEEDIPFEKDVRYSLVLPAGSLSSIYRDDIVNEEVRIDFVGCYVDPSLPFSYVWCSLYDEQPEVLGIVGFRYNRFVSVAQGGAVQLWEKNGPVDETLVREVTPYMNTDVNCFLLEADFGGYVLEPGKTYSVVIPEDAIISEDEMGVGCSRSSLTIGNTAGAAEMTADPTAADAPVYDIYGRKVSNPRPGTLYIRAGKKFIHR